LERLFYKVIGPISKKEMSAKRYGASVLLLSISFTLHNFFDIPA
jgi:K+-transporting ATPase ATPase A chain